MQNSPAETLKPFHLTTTDEICQEDKEFVVRAMKLDPRDRPTAKELLEDKWFDPDPVCRSAAKKPVKLGPPRILFRLGGLQLGGM